VEHHRRNSSEACWEADRADWSMDIWIQQACLEAGLEEASCRKGSMEEEVLVDTHCCQVEKVGMN
jgi:hypothetical protein